MAVVSSLHESARASANLGGTVLSDRYRVTESLRSSAMSHVYVAEDLVKHKRVAIKVLRDELCDERSLCRFFLEARVGRLLSSNPYTVAVTDLGFTDRGTPYFVMDYLVGEDLATHLKRRKRVGAEEAVRIILELCQAVAGLHDAGIVHRDIKPSNVFLTRDGRVRLIDFGVCKLSNEENLELTHTGELVGSLHYVPPERWADPDDARLCGDVWAIAVILYELVSGRLPFKGQSRDSLRQAVLTEELVLRFDGEERCPELHTVLLVALHKDPRYRYGTVKEFAAALSRAAFDAGLVEEPSWSSSDASEHLDASGEIHSSSERSPTEGDALPRRMLGQSSSRRRAITGLLLLAGGLSALGAWFALSNDALPGAFPAQLEPSPPPSAPLELGVSGLSPHSQVAASLDRVRGDHADSLDSAARRPTPPASSDSSSRRSRPTTQGSSTRPPPTSRDSSLPGFEEPLPRPADPDFGSAPPAVATQPASPSPSAPAPSAGERALDVTPADLRRF